jgi:hypothetical protein
VSTNLQNTSTSPLKDASGNPIKSASTLYSSDDTSNAFYNVLKGGDYATMMKNALTGVGGDSSSSKAFLASVAARVAADQGAAPPTAAQLAAAQGDQDVLPEAATYTPPPTTPLAPHQTPAKLQVQLKPELASYLTNPSLRANVRQETKNAIADALTAVDNEYEVKYVYA